LLKLCIASSIDLSLKSLLKQSVLRELRSCNAQGYAIPLLNASLIPKLGRYFSPPHGLDELTALLLNNNKPMLQYVFIHKHNFFEKFGQCIEVVCRTITVEGIGQFVNEVLI
jgi:hypothetical protein